MTQRKGLRGILALLCAMTLLIGAIGPAWATEAAPLTDGGTQEVTPAPDGDTPAPDGNTPAPNGETPPPAPQTKPVITSWSWADPNGYLEEGVLLLSEKQVDYNGVTSYLPETITAQVDGQAAPVTVDVVNWHCEEFTGLVSSGEFTFKAQIASDYTLKEGAPALEVKVKFQQPVTDDTGDTTENTTAPAAPTPPASEVMTVESWTWVDSMQALSDDGKLHLKEEITDGNLPEIQKLLPQSILAGEHTISLTWTYSKETKTFTAKLPEGYALAEGALTVAVVVEQVTMLPAAPIRQVIYVGNENVTSGGYWTTGNDGTVTAFTGEGTPADNFIHYDAGNNVLTLHNATIKKGLDYDEDITGGTFIMSSAIGVFNQVGKAELTIQLEGSNTIAEVGKGICVLEGSNSTSSSSLTIMGNGSLDASAIQSGIFVQSNTGNAALSIKNAKVTATVVNSSDGNGVYVTSAGNSSASLTVDGGSLTATGSGAMYAGIKLQIGSGGSVSGTPTVTVSNNAIVRANGSAGGITSNSSTGVQTKAGTDGTGGIVFDGNTGTVYGKVELQEDLTINQGETLTIPENASLTTNDKLIVNGGTLEGKDRITGTVKYVPVITTQPTDANVTAGKTATFNITATGDELTYQWEQSTDNGSKWTKIDGATTDTYTTAATTAEMNGYQYRCVVTGKGGEKVTSKAAILAVTSVAVTGVTLNKPSLSLAVGGAETLIATVSPENATGKTVTWSSDNKGVATVDSNGKVTAVSVGTAKITAKAGDETAVCTVTVKQAVTLSVPATYKTTYNSSAVTPYAIPKTASVPGSWEFVDESGNTISNPKDAGTYEMVLKFTPTDTDKYAAATANVKVTIEKAPLKVSVKLSKTKIAVNSTLPTVSLSYSGLMGNDKMQPKVEPKFEGMPSGKKTGTYTISLKNVDEMKEAINDLEVSKNYDITYVTSAKLSVVSGTNPLTADTSNIQLWTAIMIISGIGLIVLLVVMVVLNKKNKRRRRRRTPPKMEE